MDDFKLMTKELNDQDFSDAIKALTHILDMLGWQIAKPTEEIVCGLVIGTPEYIDAFEHVMQKRKDEMQ